MRKQAVFLFEKGRVKMVASNILQRGQEVI